MAPKFSKSHILRETSDDNLLSSLFSFASEFAVLGHISTSRTLISLVNKHVPLYRQNFAGPRPLWLVWSLTNSWPEGEEQFVVQEAERDGVGREDIVPKMAREWEAGSWEAAGFKNKTEQLFDETRLKACVTRLEAFNGNKLADATTGWMAIDKSSILVKALEIAIVLREQGHAGKDLPNEDEISGWIAEGVHRNQMNTFLTQSEKAWTVLKDGALAKAIGVKDELVEKLGVEVIETFKLRYEKGVQRSEMWEKSIEELVHIISDNTVVSPAAKMFWEEVYGNVEGNGGLPTSILKHALPHKELVELEERLDISLPEDYKTFLATTNGMDASWAGIMNDPPLYPASEVRWITEEENYFTDLDAQLLPGALNLMRDAYDKGEWPKVGTPLFIGLYDIYCIWLLPPAKVKELVQLYLTQKEKNSETKEALEKAMIAWAGSVDEFKRLEWCVISWASGGSAYMMAWPSFKAYLVHKAENSGEDSSAGDVERAGFSYSCR